MDLYQKYMKVRADMTPECKEMFLASAEIQENHEKSFDELWIVFSMKELYGMRWNGETWEKIKEVKE